jgi:hypothetical protein
MTDTTDDQVFAVPGEYLSIIDVVNPETGRSRINGHTLEEIRQRYPTAVQMPWEEWRQGMIARQQTPITWKPIDAHRYNDMLGVLPPIDWTSAGFLVGEPYDHSMATGQPRYTAFIDRYGWYYESSRPITRREWREFQTR